MGSTFFSLHYHVVFSTKERRPTIRPEWRERLHAYLGGIIRNQGGVAETIGGVEDHVHLLISLRTTHCLANLMRDLKKDSSNWVAENFDPDFGWQEGYAVFSVSATHVEPVRAYILGQEEHHRRTEFLVELKALLEKNGFNTTQSISHELPRCQRSVVAPLQGASCFGTRTGGLRCASTFGYFLASLRLAQRGIGAGPERSRVKQRALILAAIGLCLWVVAVREGKWAWGLTWLGLDFLVISVAYAFKAPGVFGKRSDGTMPWWSQVVFLPYFAISAVVWNLSQIVSREPAANVVSKELVVGRRLAGGEPAPEFENCLDLTAEFQEPFCIRNTPGYLSFPVLDAGIPDPEALKRLISGLKPGRTFVHCAQGHVRTGMVALAILLTLRAVDSIDEGMRLLRVARPGIRLNQTQRRFIDDYVRLQMRGGGGQ